MPHITLGLEEELQVVDVHTLALVAHDVAAGQAQFPDANGTSCGEAHHCVLEVQTPVCQNPDEVLVSLGQMRGVAMLRAQAQGQRVAAGGAHPFAHWQSLTVRDDRERYPHYARIVDEYQDVVRSMCTCGTHLHIGVDDARLRVHLLNGLRHVMPPVLALSASSPFHEGRDTGLATWRHSLLDRMPRMGTAEPWASEPAYWEHVRKLQATGCIEPGFNLWGDIRLHHRFPTVEVRVLDAMPRLSRNWLVTTLLFLEAHRLVHEAEQGVVPVYLPRELINENKWRVRRYGMNARVVDWSREMELPLEQHLWAWADQLAPYARQHGLDERLRQALAEAMEEGSSSDEQRSVFAKTGQMTAVVAHLVEQTSQSWASAEVAA